MSEHRATVEWKRSGEFRYETYSRSHTLAFDGVSMRGAAHHRAHEKCFIANSVKTKVIVEPCLK